MPQLLTRNQEESDKLVEELSHTIFKSPTDFLAAYEQGWINRANDEIKAIAARIVDVYQNVQFKGREIIFVSQSEVMVDEIIDGLHPWKTITKLKRAIVDSHDQNKHGDTVYFTVDNAGYVLYQNSDGELVKLTSEKLFRNTGELFPVYTRYSSFASETPNPEALLPDKQESDPADLAEHQESDEEYAEDENHPFLDEDDEDVDADNREEVNKDTDTTPKNAGVYKFKINDLTSIDDSFIEEIYELFERNV